MIRNRVLAYGMALASAGALACSPSTRVTDSPPTAPPGTAVSVSVLSTEEPQIGSAGAAFTFDVAESKLRFHDPLRAGLALAVTLSQPALGLSVTGTRIGGTLRDAGVVNATVVATDANGNRAEGRIPIVSLSADLEAPLLPAVPFAYADGSDPLPAHLANSPTVMHAENTPAANPTTDAGAALGRVLFYDRRLSVNDRVSCASCHQQQYAFADTARFSVGVNGRTSRHSMPLTNVRFYAPSRFFRDERAASLEALVLQPVSDIVEMGLSADLIVPKLRTARFYPALFRAAFGDSTITTERTASALAQFVRALRSTQSTLDSAIGQVKPFTPEQQQAFNMFDLAGCRACHESYVAVSDSARNTGLDASTVDQGAGRGRFKSPSLRNVALRPPYMHDGRFRTLSEVIDFYDSGVQNNPDLDRRLRAPDGSPRRLHLTPAQKSLLLTFLGTLTDRRFLSDPRFADPFPH